MLAASSRTAPVSSAVGFSELMIGPYVPVTPRSSTSVLPEAVMRVWAEPENWTLV